MLRSKTIALLLVLTMLMTAFPFGLVAVAVGDVAHADFNSAVEAFLTDMTSGMDPADVKVAFRQLESRLTTEGGLSALQTDISGMSADDPGAVFGTEMTNRFLQVLSDRSMTAASAAQVAGLFGLLGSDEWTDVFDLIDSPEIPALVTDSTAAAAVSGTMVDWSVILDIIEAEIDSGSLNAYLLNRALGELPAFMDAADSGMALADISGMKPFFDNAFSGLNVNDIPYSADTSFGNIFSTWLSALNVLEGQPEVKAFFLDHGILQDADATSIRLAPYLETMRAGDDSEPMTVDVVFFNNLGTIADLGVGAYQMTLNYDPAALDLDRLLLNGQSLDFASGSHSMPGSLVLFDVDEAAGKATLAVTLTGGTVNASTEDDVDMVNAEFYALGSAPGGFTDVYVDNLVFLDGAGQEMALPDAVYDAFYDIKVDADFVPVLSDVRLDGFPVASGETVVLYKDSAEIEVLVEPFDAAVTINGSQTAPGPLGQISREMAGLEEGDTQIVIAAVNSYGNDGFTFTVTYNAGPEALVEAAEVLTAAFGRETVQADVDEAFAAYEAALTAVGQMPESPEKTALEARLAGVLGDIDAAESALFAEAQAAVASAEALVAAFNETTTQEDIDAAQAARDGAWDLVDALTTEDYASEVDEAAQKTDMTERLAVVQAAIDTAQDALYQRQADEAAAGVTEIEAPVKDATEITLPVVDGYTVTIKASSNEAAVSPDGAVVPPYEDTDVVLVLALTNDTTGKTADTVEITVTVPQSSKGEAVDAVNGADAAAMGAVLADHESVIGIDLTGSYSNLVDNADVLSALVDGQPYTTVEAVASVFDAALAERVAYEDAKDILTFKFEAFNPALEESVTGVVNAEEGTVSVMVPYGTDVSNLLPTITLSPEASVSPKSGHAADFSEAVDYTVTALNGTAKVFEVTVVQGEADSSSDLSSLSVAIGQNGVALSPAFDAAVTTYTALVPYDVDSVSVSALPESPLSRVLVDGTEAGDGAVLIDDLAFGDNEITIVVTAQDGLSETTYTLTVSRQSNGAAVMETFLFEAALNEGLENDAVGVIEGTEVSVTVPHGTDVSGLVPTITVSEGADVAPGSGEISDFSTPAGYSVVSQDGLTTVDYTVAVTESDNTEAAMLSFVFEADANSALDSDAAGVIDGNSVSVTVPYGTDVSGLVPTITVSEGADVAPGSGEISDFSTPAGYSVVSQDGETESTYIVTVVVMPELIVSGVSNGSIVSHDITVTGYLPGRTITIADGTRTVTGSALAAMAFTEEGEYAVTVEASEGAGSENLSFTIDKTAPGVSMDGISNGVTYTNPEAGLVPTFSFTGDYAETAVLLNGRAFEAGTAIRKGGSYVLTARATDAAGNTASETVSFSIAWDMAQPVIVITGAADGGVYESATVEIALDGGTNIDAYTYEAALNPGGVFTSGTELTEEGAYILEVKAVNPSFVDVFSAEQIFFEIDNNAPVVELDIPTGARFNKPVVPCVAFQDAVASQAYLREHATVSLQKDGILTPYDIGDPLTEDGSYILRVTAYDRAGHASETAETTFAIDTRKPVVTLTGAIDGATYRTPVTLGISTNETADISVQKGETVGSGAFAYEEASAPYTFEGTSGEAVTYHIVASAEDAAGNTGEGEVKFTIDRKPLNIVISGVANDGIYNADRVVAFSTYDSEGNPVAGTTATLDGNPFGGGTVSEEGSYILAVSNGGTTKIVRFTIDKTAPAFTVVGSEKVDDDGYEPYNAGDILKVTATIAGAGGTEAPWSTVGTLSGRIPMTLVSSGPGYGVYECEWMVPGGNHTDLDVTVWARDAAGNLGSASAGVIDIDNAAPVVKRSVTPAAPDGLNGYYSGSGFSILLEAGPAERIHVEVNGSNSLGDTGSFTLTAGMLADEASNMIRYYATDVAGNTSSIGTFKVLLDTQAPASPIVDNYNGVVNTADAFLTGSVAGEGGKTGSRVLLLDEGDVAAVGAIAADGSFLVDGIVLDSGVNTYTLVAEDIAGNRSGGASVTITLDLTAPRVAIERRDDTHYRVLTDENVAADAVTAFFNNELADVTPETAPSGMEGYHVFIVEIQAPAEGKNTLDVFVEDPAGNIGKGAYTWQFVPPAMDLYNIEIADGVYVDIPAGAFESATLMKIQSSLTEANGEFNALMSPLGFIFGQAPAEPLVLKFFVGTGRSGMVLFHYDPLTMATPAILHAQDRVSSAFPGLIDFSAADEDQPYYLKDMGYLVIKTRNFSEYNPAVDVTAPGISISSTDFGINASEAAAGIVLSGTLTDQDPAAHVARVEVDGTPMDLSGEDVDKSFNITLSLSDGGHEVVLRAEDTAGNFRTKTLAYTVDTVVPDVSASVAKSLTNAETGTISVSVDEEVSVSINGSPYGSVSGVAEFAVALNDNQANSFEVSGSDALGNTDSATVVITRDSTAPVLSVAGISDGDVIGTDKTIIVAATEGTPAVRMDGADFTNGSVFSVAAGDGSHILSAEATDAAGNKGILEIGFTVDTAVPAITIAGAENGAVYNNNRTLTLSTDAADLTYTYTVRDVDGTILGTRSVEDGGPIQTVATDVADGEYGHYTYVVTAAKTVEGVEKQAVATIAFAVDRVYPELEVSAPVDGSSTAQGFTAIEGSVNTKSNIYVNNVLKIYGQEAGTFSISGLALETGANTFEVKAVSFVDAAKEDLVSTTVTRTMPVAGGGGGGGTPSGLQETAEVGEDAETVSFLNEEVRMSFEAGTFDRATDITVKAVETETPVLYGTEGTLLRMGSSVFELDAEGRTFGKPVTLTLTYRGVDDLDNPKKLGIYLLDEETDTWKYVGGKVDPAAKTVTVVLDHFSTYGVMAYEKAFTDTADHWAGADIALMASRHIANGMTETEFAPEGTITRAQFATLLVRALGLELSEEASAFGDVEGPAWYRHYVMTAFRAGLVNGMGDGAFAPDANITREQMAVMIMRAYDELESADYLGMATTTQLRFMDETTIAAWAHHAVLVANDLGIINGMTADTFAPGENATRAQAIVMIKRLLGAADEL